MALAALGEDPLTLETLSSMLRLSVDAVFRQRGRPAAYGHKINPTFKNLDVKSNGPFTAVSVVKPDYCPCCGQRDGRFKNLGEIVN